MSMSNPACAHVWSMQAMKKRIMSPARFDFSWFRRTAYQQTELHGSGMMRNLFAAASRSPEVADTLKVYGMAVTREEQNNLLDQLLLGWAATCVMDDM